MKTQSLLLLGGIWGIATASAAAPPPKLEIVSQGLSIGLRAMDRENGSWVLQSSTDLTNWTDAGNPFIVRNSELSLLPPAEQGRKLYYRLNEAYLMPHRGRAVMLDLPATPYPYSQKMHDAVIAAAALSSFQVLNDTRVLLGRVLFYDRRLSKDNSVACASCHRQEYAFADNVAFSRGHLGGLTTRNAAAPIDLPAYGGGQGVIFWDGHSKSLRSAVLEPISHAVEMGLAKEELIAKLSLEPYYAELFSAGYGTAEVTTERIGLALEEFINAIPRFNSKFDQLRMKTATYTPTEKAGRDLFVSKCMSCHALVGSPRTPFANNGLDMEYKDQGVAARTGSTTERGWFKIPNLRQVSLTAPYMHDGRFSTLRQVIDHYSEGIKPHPNLSYPLTSTGPMHFTEEQKQSLEDFLKMLTDPDVTTNPAFGDPFRRN